MINSARAVLDRLVNHPAGVFAVLGLAALLEASGDSFFQTSFYRSSGVARICAFAAGTVTLAAYGSCVNAPRWSFGRLLGLYVVFFFVLAQALAKLRFGQSPTASIYAGGALILAGGMVIAFWNS